MDLRLTPWAKRSFEPFDKFTAGSTRALSRKLDTRSLGMTEDKGRVIPGLKSGSSMVNRRAVFQAEVLGVHNQWKLRVILWGVCWAPDQGHYTAR